MGQDSLKEIRKEIDKLDEKILDVLSKRKGFVEEVIKFKKKNKVAFYQPGREVEIIKRLLRKAPGKKLDKEFVQKLYQLIISYFRNKELVTSNKKVESFKRIATLGPRETFSDIVTKKFIQNLNLNSKIIYYPTIPEIFDAVLEKEVDLGIVPFENSTEGSVRQTLDELFKNDVHIFYSLNLSIHQVLAGKSENKIKEIISHEQSFAQCSHFIRSEFPNAEISFASSNAQAMIRVKNSKKKGLAAIGPQEAALKYGLKVIEENIEDNKNNVTKFVVIRPEIQEEGDITSIALYGHEDRPGLLYDTLGTFAKKKINLTRIESRPAKSHLGDYVFYIDFESELINPKVKKLLEEVKRQSFKIKTFGSYKELE